MASSKLTQLNERIGAMSLRERGFVFAAVVIVALAVVQTLLIDVAQQRKQTAQARLSVASLALESIAQQRSLHAGPVGRDPDQAARDALAKQEARLAQLNAELEVRERSLIPPERMREVLRDVVRGQPGIRIDGFKTLSPQPVALPDAVEGALPGFYRHGFEVTVKGGYADLVAYLEKLEAMPWNLGWSEARLDAAARPELTLTLIIHTLSLEEAWLRV
jgi:MSHA biogenesis protein MshJ